MDYKKCEEILQRGRLLSLITFLPLILVALSTYQVMTAIGIEEEVANHVHNYTMFLYPGMFIYI